MTDYRLNLLLILATLMPLPLLANEAAPAEGAHAAEGSAEAGATNAPRLEIRKYRFFHDSRLKRERLVLEFDWRDFYHDSNPRLQFEALSSQEILVKMENAILLGAIPESLINDSYAHQSQYMGPISMDDRNMESGLALKMKLKDFDLGYNAQWLASPYRLVIDVFSKNSLAAKQLSGGYSESRHPKSLTIEHKFHVPSVADFLCFPAKAKVGLAVVFQPTNQNDELQKFRVNTDGSAIGMTTPVEEESIICYPRQSQVKAALSFQPFSYKPVSAHKSISETEKMGLLDHASEPGVSATGPVAHGAAAPTAKPPGVADGSDADLDPGPIEGHDSNRGTASQGPASLLPPLH